MANDTVREIARAEAAAFRGTDPVVVRSIVPLMRLLLDGAPVSTERFAASAGIPPAEARAVFERLRAWGAEFDAEGHVVGAGLTLVPTPHRYAVDGRAFYTWCVPDAILFPLVLGHTATIASPDPVGGATIRLTIGPQGVESCTPEGAVVSSRSAGFTTADVRGSICQYGHFFASRDTAAAYAARHSSVPLGILAPQEAFRVAQISASSTFNYTPLLAAALLYLCVTIPLARLLDHIQKRSR
jgi:alkylmercury lyase